MRHAVVVVLALLVTPGCEKPWERALREARAVDVDVPGARTKGVSIQGGPRTRVVVRAEGIGVDQSDLAGAMSDGAREKLGPRMVAAPRALPLRRFASTAAALHDGFLLPGLLGILRKAAHVERELADLDPARPFDGALEVAFSRDTPFELVARVLYTAGQAEYSRWALRLRGGWVEVEAPRIGHDPDHDHGLTCAAPDLQIGATGILVRASAGGEQVRAELPVRERAALAKMMESPDLAKLLGGSVGSFPPASAPQATPSPPASTPHAEPAWIGAVMLGPSRACPSVPKRDGRHDLRALAALLGEIERLAPGCDDARISAAKATPFEDVAGVIETLEVDSPFVHPLLAIAVEETAPRCEGGMRPSR